MNIIKDIKEGKLALNELEFNQYIEFFLQDDEKIKRLELYSEKMQEDKLPNLAAAKHSFLIQIFSTYIQNLLSEANKETENTNPEKIKSCVNQLSKLRDVFKNHDVMDYKEFILLSDNKITETEIDLLFLDPLLNKEELNKLSKAFILAFSKKNKKSNNKKEYQEKFFKHPLIQCLDAYSDFKIIEKHIENETLQLGNYKNLVKAVLSLREKIDAEEYQGFITYVIHEDLTVGFSNIIKNENYKPEHLRRLIKNMSEGKELNNELLKDLINEIKTNHTKNFSLNNRKELVQNVNSMFSLNDYGYYVNINNEKILFHGHATENSGANQRNQQSNTAYIARNFKMDSIGLTVLKDEVTRTDHHKTFIRELAVEHLINMSQTEEIIVSGLQFDAANLGALGVMKLTEDQLKTSDFLSSNHYIIKSDINRSQKIIENNIGKNDFELICEKKNAYLGIIEKNKDLFKALVDKTSTENELNYQLLTNPFISFIDSIITLEKNAKIEIFTGKEIELFKEILSVTPNNYNLQVSINNCLERIDNRNIQNLKTFDVSLYSGLKNLGINDVKKNNNSSIKEIKDHVKIIKKSNLSKALDYIETHSISGKEYSKSYKKKTINALMQKISETAENSLDYRIDKKEKLVNSITSIGNVLISGSDMYFAPSDWMVSSHYEGCRTLSHLLKTKDKTENQINDEKLLLNGLLTIADLSGSKLTCYNTDLRKTIKP